MGVERKCVREGDLFGGREGAIVEGLWGDTVRKIHTKIAPTIHMADFIIPRSFVAFVFFADFALQSFA